MTKTNLAGMSFVQDAVALANVADRCDSTGEQAANLYFQAMRILRGVVADCGAAEVVRRFAGELLVSFEAAYTALIEFNAAGKKARSLSRE